MLVLNLTRAAPYNRLCVWSSAVNRCLPHSFDLIENLSFSLHCHFLTTANYRESASVMMDSFMMRPDYAELAKTVHSTFGSLTTVFLFTRLWARSTQYKGLWWDDYLRKPVFFRVIRRYVFDPILLPSAWKTKCHHRPRSTLLAWLSQLLTIPVSDRSLGSSAVRKWVVRCFARLRLQHPRRHFTRLDAYFHGCYLLLPRHGFRQIGLCRYSSSHLRRKDQDTTLVHHAAHLGHLDIAGCGDLAGYM